MASTFTHAVILDFEATCDDRNAPRPQEIIEFPSVLLSLATLENIDEFESFVRPHHHPTLTDFCRQFTSIRQTDVDAADFFVEVFTRHQAWLDRHQLDEQNAIVVTCGDWDLGTMLPAQCCVAAPPVAQIPPIYSRWHNLKRSFCAVRNRSKAPGMAGMMNELGLSMTGHHHRGIDDCRNLVELCKALLGLGAQLEITATLAPSKHPPITLRLRLGERVEEVLLTNRSVSLLTALAGKIFRCRLSEMRRLNGNRIADDLDLLLLSPGEEIQLQE